MRKFHKSPAYVEQALKMFSEEIFPSITDPCEDEEFMRQFRPDVRNGDTNAEKDSTTPPP